MFMHSKRLMYTARVSEQNPALATFMLKQFGGPQRGVAEAMRYFTQAMSEKDPDRRDMLRDIATGELARLEVIGSIVCMLGKTLRGTQADGMRDGELMADVAKGGESHTLSLLNGDGSLVGSAGVPWAAVDVDTIAERAAGLRSGIAAEARARLLYERLINATDDPGIRDAVGFLMAHGMEHQRSLEKALYTIEPNSSSGRATSEERNGLQRSTGGTGAPRNSDE
jgi:Mn-containing catalase